MTPLMFRILAVAYPELDGRLRASQQTKGAVTPPKVGKGQKKSPKSGRSSTAEKTAIIPAAQEATANPIVTGQEATARVSAQEGSPIVSGQEATARVSAQEGSPIVSGQEATARVSAQEGSPIVSAGGLPLLLLSVAATLGLKVLLDLAGFTGTTLLAHSVIQVEKFMMTWSRSDELFDGEVLRTCPLCFCYFTPTVVVVSMVFGVVC
ncbi:hypothetical protein NDU88_001318 [Pleurodeles waltl]|uniref:Uncharacterized protein n=1 Tax=Pleurodeles waltl TaxID=8319 RepID=A0AAV7LCS5_PLEWA|nr:hypothetical protein NDU88_001318 [Pleurodeles waltl]